MSKMKRSESGQPSEETGLSGKAFTIIIILCFLGVMPVLIWVSLPDSSSHTSVSTTTPMVESAVSSAGLQICTQEHYPVDVPGGQSAVLYELSPDCSTVSTSTTVKVLVIGFISAEAMNTALAQAENTYQNWRTLNTEVFTSGDNVLVVQGSPGNENVQQIGASFIADGASQVI